MFDVIIGGICTTPLYILYAGSTQQAPPPPVQPPVVQSSITNTLTHKLSEVHVGPTSTVKLIVKGPTEEVPQSTLPVLSNLQPGPKFNPPTNVCCMSHTQLPAEPAGLSGAVIGVKFIHAGHKFISNA